MKKLIWEIDTETGQPVRKLVDAEVVVVPVEDLRAGATTRIEASIDETVMSVAGNPSPREVASWPGKIEAAQAVLAGATEAKALVPVQIKHQVDVAGAAAIVLLNARLYALANTAAEAMVATYVAQIALAPDQASIDAIETAFVEAKGARLEELGLITQAAKAGDLAPLEAAEAELQAAA